jgi:hypothetical protein
MKLTIIDVNPHPDAVVTTVRSDRTGRGIPQPVSPGTWTVIGMPTGPDLVIDPRGQINSISWGGPKLAGFFTEEALAVYEFVNKELVK